MTKASDYIIYVDESGDHSLEKVNPDFPAFCLTFCLVEKLTYSQSIVPRMMELKFRWFGHDMVILHESDIRKRINPFVFLGDPEKHKRFMAEINALVNEAPMTVISGVIMKSRLIARYATPMNPYSLALLFCMEKADHLLAQCNQQGRLTHIVVEARSPRRQSPHVGKEDQELMAEFQAIREGRHPLRNNRPLPGFEMIFADKKANSTGLQLADLLARPIALSKLRPEQPNRAFEIISKKLILKVFP